MSPLERELDRWISRVAVRIGERPSVEDRDLIIEDAIEAVTLIISDHLHRRHTTRVALAKACGDQLDYEQTQRRRRAA